MTNVSQQDAESKPSQKSMSDGHEYEEVLELIGFGCVQWVILIASGLLLMMVINETMGMSYITIVSQCDFQTNSVYKAVMSAASFVGIFCSSYFWGYLSDAIGRKPVLIYTTLCGNLLSLISIIIPNFWIFVVARFLVGFFIAGASSTTYAYLGEFFIPRHRPIVINYASLFVGISTIYVPAVAWFVMSMDWSLDVTESFTFRPWRLLTVFYFVPGLIGAMMLIKMPESPKILLSMGRTDEAYAAVEWIALKNIGKHLHDLKVEALKSDAFSDRENILSVSKSPTVSFRKMWAETAPLLKRPHLKNFCISCIVMCGLFFSSSGMGLWYPEILNRLGSSVAEDAMTVCDVIEASVDQWQANITTDVICNDQINTKSYIDTITYGSALITGYIVMGFVINQIGRKASITVGLAIAAGCALSLVWIKNEAVIIVCFCLYLVLPGLCVSVLSGVVVDLVPTNLRGKAVCICLMLGRTGSVFGSNIIGILLESYCHITFGLFSGFVLFCALLAFLLPM
ncbi:PREDICTED: synaptic vesicle glycoprotein 2C isoform X1 [Drosophila arizonae]|uniref:Synaptic vesicle glycoprotein 2C isoform X1 n=1 Tax=Drosophila arizonae TaxID=7263 RepID=A0ABM1Q3C0_DROAR|nr:PREDICTED: synaptic vesicle glycoprotein 2C isoform X1 [Drosophila arizonae]